MVRFYFIRFFLAMGCPTDFAAGIFKILVCNWKEEKEELRKTTQAAKHSLHQLRKRRHIGLKCRESPPPKE
jgi:hypothetical protein